MKKEVGLWVDYRKAVIVTLKNGLAVTREIVINMEKQVRFSSSSADNCISTNAQGSNAEDIQVRKFANQLN